MRGARLTASGGRKAPSDRLALKPYWGKPTVRNFRGDDGNVGIIRSPVRAIVLLDRVRRQAARPRPAGAVRELTAVGGVAEAERGAGGTRARRGLKSRPIFGRNTAGQRYCGEPVLLLL